MATVIEQWHDLDAWEGDTEDFATLVGGRYLVPEGGDGSLPIITRPVSIPAGSRFRLVSSLTRSQRGWGLIGVEGTEDTWAVGVDDSGGDIIGVQLSTFAQPELGGQLDAGDEASIAIVGDERGVSFAVTTDVAGEICSMWQPWSEIGDIEAIWIVAGDPDAAMYIGPLGLDDTGATISPRDGIEGLRPTAIEVYPTSAEDRALIMLPATYDSAVPAHAVIHCHGATQGATEIFGGGTINTAPVAQAMLDEGWIVASGDFADDSFGNPTSVERVGELADWIEDHLSVDRFALTSDSMGGTVALNTLVTRDRAWAAWVGWEPLCRLYSDDASWWDGNPYAATFRAAYGVSADWSDLDEKAGPHDPIRRPSSAYAGLRAKLWASYDDLVVPRDENADAFAALVPSVEVATSTGNHNDPSHYDPAAVVEFLRAALDPPAGPRAWALSGGRPVAVTPRDAAGSPVALHMEVS